MRGTGEEARRRILAVFAHPDDETTTSGGTLARYSQRGVEVFVATATRGEQGTLGTGVTVIAREGLADVREAEMRSVLRKLGLRPPIFLGYRDQEIINADFEKLVAQIEALLNRISPDVVITWGPTGVSGHDDHIGVHRATAEAFHRHRVSAEGDPRLYFVAIPEELAKQIEFDLHESEATPTVIVDIKEYKALKLRALRMYRSQQDAQEVADMFEADLFDVEAFHQAYPPLPDGRVSPGFWD